MREEKCPKCGSAVIEDCNRYNKEFWFTCDTVTYQDTNQIKLEGYKCLRNQLVQAKAVIDKLPKTADESILPYHIYTKTHKVEVYHPLGVSSGYAALYDDEEKQWTVQFSKGTPGSYIRVPLSECYSTKEAAEAAKGKENEND